MTKTTKDYEESLNKNTSNTIRITLENPSPVVQGGEDPEIAEISITVPEEYADFEIVGVSHEKNGTSYEDVFGTEHPILMSDWFQPIFSDNMRRWIYDDIRDLLDISLVNQRQNQTLFKLLQNSIYRKAEEKQERSARIHSTKKKAAQSIKASIESK